MRTKIFILRNKYQQIILYLSLFLLISRDDSREKEREEKNENCGCDLFLKKLYISLYFIKIQEFKKRKKYYFYVDEFSKLEVKVSEEEEDDEEKIYSTKRSMVNFGMISWNFFFK